MAKLDRKIRTCKLCRLHESRTNAVPGDGYIQRPDIVFVGEGPGRQEDLAGTPFVGAAGKVLNSMLRKAGIERTQVYITNIVKCRPPANRKPLADEVEACTTNYLIKQIELLQPLVVCTLGGTALEYFTGQKKMGERRGKITMSKDGRIPIFPTYHPAAVFRNQSLRAILEADLMKLPSILEYIREGKKL